MIDLTIQYLGLKLKNPIIIASSTLEENYLELVDEITGSVAIIFENIY